MPNPNQPPNYDAYNADPETNTKVIEVLHRIGKIPLDQSVRLHDNLLRQGTSEELARLLTGEQDTGAVYI